jgi:hypothetical protein
LTLCPTIKLLIPKAPRDDGPRGHAVASQAVQCAKDARSFRGWTDATDGSASRLVSVVRGTTTSRTTRRGETGSAGAFSPHPSRHLLPTAGRSPAGHHPLMSAPVLAPGLRLHPPCRLGLLHPWGERPAYATAPDHERSARPHRGVAALIPRGRALPDGAFDHEPDRVVRMALGTPGDLALGDGGLDGTVGACGDSPPLPNAVMAAAGHGRPRHRGLCWLGDDTGGVDCSRRGGWRGLPDGSLQPTAGRPGAGHPRERAPVCRNRLKQCGARPLQTIGHRSGEGVDGGGAEVPHPGRRARGCGLTPDVLWDRTRGASGRLRRRHPGLGPAAALVPPRRALPGGGGGQHAPLTLLAFASGPTRRSRHAHGVVVGVRKARLIAEQHPLRRSQVVIDQTRDGRSIGASSQTTARRARGIARTLAPLTRRAMGALEGRSKVLSWPPPRAKERCPRLAPGQTVVAGVRNPPQVGQQAFDVPVVHAQRGDGHLLPFQPTGWYHSLPPHGGY